MSNDVSPSSLLRQAIKAVPAVKYALGVAGVIAVIALVTGSFKLDIKIAVFGAVIMFTLMTVLVVFASTASQHKNNFSAASLVFTWFSLILVMATATALFTSVFVDWPLRLSQYVVPLNQEKPDQVTKQEQPIKKQEAPSQKQSNAPAETRINLTSVQEHTAQATNSQKATPAASQSPQATRRGIAPRPESLNVLRHDENRAANEDVESKNEELIFNNVLDGSRFSSIRVKALNTSIAHEDGNSFYVPQGSDFTFTGGKIFALHDPSDAGDNVVMVDLRTLDDDKPGVLLEQMRIELPEDEFSNPVAGTTFRSTLYPKLHGGTEYWLGVYARHPGSEFSWYSAIKANGDLSGDGFQIFGKRWVPLASQK